ncbi:MAG: hypothetical protein ACYC3L_03235 [Gemmatimonadaceae bacterium]
MKFGTMLAVAAIAAFARTASAETVRYDFSCNSDGFIHVIAWQSSGYGFEYSTGERCGPELRRVGPRLSISIALKTQVSPGSQEFLNSLEKGAPITTKRMPGQRAGAARDAGGGAASIELARGDVRPRLAALLASIDADARRGDAGPSKVLSIFDRWGNLLTARSEPALVPGDAGLTFVRPAKGAAEGRNAKQRCLDKHGFWRNTGGEWGCWTTAK